LCNAKDGKEKAKKVLWDEKERIPLKAHIGCLGMLIFVIIFVAGVDSVYRAIFGETNSAVSFVALVVANILLIVFGPLKEKD